MIGATNRPELLDDALLRPGRLDQLIYIPLPDLNSRLQTLHAKLKKSPIAPNVPLTFIAQKTEGFSGADIENLCQIAAKSAIRDAIASDELKAGADGDADMGDEVVEITRKHFEEAFAGARRSVSMTDLNKYDNFRMKYDPVYKQSHGSGADTYNIQWPDDNTNFEVAAADDDDDDLYS